MIYRAEPFELSAEDTKYIRDTYKTDKFLRPGTRKYYSGYHSHPNSTVRADGWNPGKFLDSTLPGMYAPFLSKSLKAQGLNLPGMILSYNHIWAQIYTKEFESENILHNHYSSNDSVCSWIHFIDVPDDQDCLYFKVGDEKFYPKNQRSGTLVFFPPWAMHGVEPVVSQDDRVVVAGNVVRLK